MAIRWHILWVRHWRYRLLLVTLAMYPAWNMSANEIEVPLLKQAKTLQCAQTQSGAKQVLDQWWQAHIDSRMLPHEAVSKKEGSATLHAATLDIVLKSLVDTATRYPKLRNQVERTLLSWNYCDVYSNGTFYDMSQEQGVTVRSKASYPSPNQWQGFKALGFFGETSNRFIPDIISFDQNNLRRDFELLFHRIYREQCFPHPDTSELFDHQGIRALQQKVTPVQQNEHLNYPHYWDPECVYPQPVPPIQTELKLLDVPMLVPNVSSIANIQDTPQLVPNLKTQLAIHAVPQLVPSLYSQALLTPVPQLVPNLYSRVLVTPVAQQVPNLKTHVKIEVMTQVVPTLKSRLVLHPVALNVPTLHSELQIVPQTQKVPALTPRLLIKPSLVHVPELASYVRFDQKPKPKVYTKPVTPAKYASGYHGGVTTAPVYHRPRVHSVQPVVQQVLQAPPNYIVDSNAPLLERLLGAINTGGNVLVIEKLQLTVNEYNGNVDTTISSSDIGTSAFPESETLHTPIKKLVSHTQVQDASVAPVSVNQGAKKQAKAYVSQRVTVPQLESLLLVAPVLQVPQPVVIKKPQKRSMSVPSLSTKVWLSAKASSKSRNRPIKKRSKQQPSTKSVFIYKPYKKGNQRSAGEKSVEELLWEYAEYEARRKAGHASKKKVNKLPEPHKSKAEVGPRKPSSSHVTQENTKEVSLSQGGEGSDQRVNFTFAEVVSDYPDMQQVTATTTPSPVGLAGDAPIPYVIEENFVNDQKIAAKKGSKKEVKKKPIGLAGNVYLKKSLGSGKWGIGGSINRKIIKDDYWFARVGWSYALDDGEDPFSYSWGIGYSDWHAGTFSAQLNNWGPIKLGEGLALDKAVASFGYSVKSELLKKYRLSLSGALNVPVKGNKSAAVNLRWSPKENWYINASISQPLEGDGTPKWSYGFGYSDWRPDKFNLQYSNYGPNDLFYHNYQRSGTWSFSYNWKF